MRSNTSITIIASSVCNRNRHYARFHLVNWLPYLLRFSKPATAKIRNSKPTAKVRGSRCKRDTHPMAQFVCSKLSSGCIRSTKPAPRYRQKSCDESHLTHSPDISLHPLQSERTAQATHMTATAPPTP